MELTDYEALQIKLIYSNVHAGEWSAEQALDTLEQIINGDSENN